MNNLFSKTIIILSITSLLIGILSPGLVLSQVEPQDLPQNLEEVKQSSKETVKLTWENLPQALKEIWSREVVPIWKKMWSGAKSIWVEHVKPRAHRFWYSQAKPKIQSVLDEIRSMLGMEIEKRKPEIKQEFEKEKQEMSEEIKEKAPKKNWWNRFKELLE